MPDTHPRKVPSQPRARETVRAMLDATAHILARGEELNTNRIAEVAGVSIGSLYQYFPSKEALVAALVERMLDEDIARTEALLGVPGPLRDKLPHLVQALCLHQADQAPLMAAILPLLSQVERDQLARGVFADLMARVRPHVVADPALRPDLIEEDRLDRALFVVGRSLRWVLNEAAISHPDWLRDPLFHAELTRIFDILWAVRTS